MNLHGRCLGGYPTSERRDYTTVQFERTETFIEAHDPRDTPTYRLSEASHTLRIPLATLRSWIVGPKALLLIADRRRGRLSFLNLIEAHLLDAIQRHDLESCWKRIVWAKDGRPTRFFPVTRKRRPNDAKAIVIDPTLAFGRPVLAGTGIATAVIADRFRSGESIRDLAKDYGRDALGIEEAIRWECSAF